MKIYLHNSNRVGSCFVAWEVLSSPSSPFPLQRLQCSDLFAVEVNTPSKNRIGITISHPPISKIQVFLVLYESFSTLFNSHSMFNRSFQSCRYSVLTSVMSGLLVGTLKWHTLYIYRQNKILSKIKIPNSFYKHILVWVGGSTLGRRNWYGIESSSKTILLLTPQHWDKTKKKGWLV